MVWVWARFLLAWGRGADPGEAGGEPEVRPGRSRAPPVTSPRPLVPALVLCAGFSIAERTRWAPVPGPRTTETAPPRPCPGWRGYGVGGNGQLGAQRNRGQRAGVLHLVGQVVQAEVTAECGGAPTAQR